MITFLPKTRNGKLSVILIIFFFLSLATSRILVAFGQRGGQGIFSNPILAVTGLLAFGFGTGAFLTGIFGIIRNKERSILVFLATILGFLISLFVPAETFFPH